MHESKKYIDLKAELNLTNVKANAHFSCPNVLKINDFLEYIILFDSYSSWSFMDSKIF